MTKYLLDTNILSYMDDEESPFHERIHSNIRQLLPTDELHVSILTWYEFEYGIAAAPQELAIQLKESKDSLLSMFSIVPLTKKGSKIFGVLKNQYSQKKEKDGLRGKELEKHLERCNVDLLLASSAIYKKAIFVSKDRIFSKLKQIDRNFEFKDWTQS